MPSLGQTIAALQRRPLIDSTPSRLQPLKWRQTNPGALNGWFYVPASIKPGAALVVVLHGCTQSAAGYDHGSGWSELADRLGFTLLFPEQTRQNNPNLCFNWFNPADAMREGGEAKSIRGMIAAMIAQHALDPAQVHITGLSAGGAMTATMLATYPEVFASGAIIAGLPHGAATDVPKAFGAMRGQGLPSANTLQTAREQASSHRGAWPRISIWHGSADKTVVAANADALFAQWQGAHGVAATPEKTSRVAGATHRIWNSQTGKTLIERWDIPGMAHGTPISPSKDGLGKPAPFMLDQGISSTAHIAAFFGLAETEKASVPKTKPRKAASDAALSTAKPVEEPAVPLPVATEPEAAQPIILERLATTTPPQDTATHGVGAYVDSVLDKHLPGKTGLFASIKTVISDALKKAGLR